jgi:hypothetical protein
LELQNESQTTHFISDLALRYMKDGLAAAADIPFWNDIVFHVLYGLF